LGGSALFNSSSLSAGSGDVNFGYEFSTTLAPNTSLTVSELLTVVPEPSSMALLSVGVVGLVAFSGRRLFSGLGKTPKK